MTRMPLEITVKATDIDIVHRYHSAVHAMLLARLTEGQDSLLFLEAINDVIAVHDEFAVKHGRDDGPEVAPSAEPQERAGR